MFSLFYSNVSRFLYYILYFLSDVLDVLFSNLCFVGFYRSISWGEVIYFMMVWESDDFWFGFGNFFFFIFLRMRECSLVFVLCGLIFCNGCVLFIYFVLGSVSCGGIFYLDLYVEWELLCRFFYLGERGSLIVVSSVGFKIGNIDVFFDY